jgi:hypothetical protein
LKTSLIKPQIINNVGTSNTRIALLMACESSLASSAFAILVLHIGHKPKAESVIAIAITANNTIQFESRAILISIPEENEG